MQIKAMALSTYRLAFKKTPGIKMYRCSDDVPVRNRSGRQKKSDYERGRKAARRSARGRQQQIADRFRAGCNGVEYGAHLKRPLDDANRHRIVAEREEKDKVDMPVFMSRVVVIMLLTILAAVVVMAGTMPVMVMRMCMVMTVVMVMTMVMVMTVVMVMPRMRRVNLGAPPAKDGFVSFKMSMLVIAGSGEGINKDHHNAPCGWTGAVKTLWFSSIHYGRVPIRSSISMSRLLNMAPTS
ncbi:MAG: hypothetical protein AAF492_27180 [Verrucomicrobiota bacterium]